MMPNHSARVKCDLPAALQQLPANVHIVAGAPETRIESPNFSEGVLAERAIASGNMFSLAVRQQYMNRAARSIGNAFGQGTVIRGSDVRSTGCRAIEVHVHPGKILEPVRIWSSVVVRVGDDFARRCFHSDISCGSKTTVADLNEPCTKLLGDSAASIR